MRAATLPLSAAAADDDLARLIAGGDDGAFDELYRRYAQGLARYAGRILRDPAAGEDVAQTALLNAYQALRRGSTPEHVRAWLYRIARNAALEVIERRGDVMPLLDDDGNAAEDTFDAQTQRADLIAAMRTLPERQRAVYVLRELKGLRVGEIGAQLGLATEQVEQAMFAARNRLAEQLEFGDRLDCASLRSLAEARLTRAQRRAVKSHLRSCAACRVDAPALRVGAFGLPLLDALRAGAAALFGGGSAAPLAAKAAAVVIAATAVGAAPVVVQRATADASATPEQVVATALPAESSRTPGAWLVTSKPFRVPFLPAPSPLESTTPEYVDPTASPEGQPDPASSDTAAAPDDPDAPEPGPGRETASGAAPVDEQPAESRPADEEPLRDPERNADAVIEPAQAEDEVAPDEHTLEEAPLSADEPARDADALDRATTESTTSANARS
jgi:RNA polymerase sigma factor (sigma-70 family)